MKHVVIMRNCEGSVIATIKHPTFEATREGLHRLSELMLNGDTFQYVIQED